MLNSPCLDCIDRELLCHSKCDKYKQFKLKIAAANKNRQQYYESKIPRIISVRRTKRKTRS